MRGTEGLAASHSATEALARFEIFCLTRRPTPQRCDLVAVFLSISESVWAAHIAAKTFSPAEVSVGETLLSLDQGHLFANWPAPGTQDADKKRFLKQAADVESAYIGGVKTYVERARKLLKLAAIGANPYEGFTVTEPKDAVRLESLQDFKKYEALGMEQMAKTGFVIVAGGLGERLGYKGIKLNLPCEISTEVRENSEETKPANYGVNSTDVSPAFRTAEFASA
jgi:hypothetical protein